MDWQEVLNNNGFKLVKKACAPCLGKDVYHLYKNETMTIRILYLINQYQIDKINVWTEKKNLTELEFEF
jgi:hypothetical protein